MPKFWGLIFYSRELIIDLGLFVYFTSFFQLLFWRFYNVWSQNLCDSFCGCISTLRCQNWKEGRTISELYCVLEWLTGYTEDLLQEVIGRKISFREFFDGAPTLNSKRNSITGVICGVRIENIEEDLMREIRYLDKLVDELAKGKKLSSILRQ